MTDTRAEHEPAYTMTSVDSLCLAQSRQQDLQTSIHDIKQWNTYSLERRVHDLTSVTHRYCLQHGDIRVQSYRVLVLSNDFLQPKLPQYISSCNIQDIGSKFLMRCHSYCDSGWVVSLQNTLLSWQMSTFLVDELILEME